MQDIHSVGGRLFGGGGGDRRLRPHHHHQPAAAALKCPRCDSLNTKFCYYNNYNLSQPRHFCKSCRRYWTKGGVLRNVPVGGGCRKSTKRSSKPKAASSDTPRAVRNSNSHDSSSESSSLTASTTKASAAAAAAAAAATPEVASAAISSNSAASTTLFSFHDTSRIFNFSQAAAGANPNFDPPVVDHSSDGGGIFPEIGSFTSMMTSSTDPSPVVEFNFAACSISAPAYRLQNQSSNQQWQQQRDQITELTPEDFNMQEITAGFLDQTAQIDSSGNQNRAHDGLGPLDWQFDLTGTVDQAYWSQTQWTDHDHTLYLP